jgi:transcriptional regulator with XRE-family HTH domain
MTRGEIIKERRLELGLTQRELSKKAEVSASLICQVENGRRSFSIKILIKLSKALNLPPERIISIELPEEKPQLDRIEEKLKIILNFIEKKIPNYLELYDIKLEKTHIINQSHPFDYKLNE